MPSVNVRAASIYQMKDDANLVILAAQVAEINHSLWLKTTSSILKHKAKREGPLCSPKYLPLPANKPNLFIFKSTLSAICFISNLLYLHPSAALRLSTMAPNLLSPIRQLKIPHAESHP